MASVEHLARHARGTQVAGVHPSRVYTVDAVTGQLRLGGASGPYGVHPDDAVEFAQFPRSFRLVITPPAPQAPVGGLLVPPPPPRRGPSVASTDADPVAVAPEADPVAPPGPGPVETATMADAVAYDTRGWLQLASDLDLGLSTVEKQTKPKAALVALIRTKARARDALVADE